MKEKKMNHTKGPWEVSMGHQIHNPDGEYVCILKRYQSKDEKTRKANAHLIAAAPDLLEACELILKEELSTLLSTELTEKAYRKINQAIKKAKGESRTSIQNFPQNPDNPR